MPRIHGAPAVSWWGTSVPTTGPVTTVTTLVGVVFQLTVPGRLNGIRFYDGTAGLAIETYGFILDDTASPSHYVATRSAHLTALRPNSWNQMWFRPWARVVVGHTYWVVVMFAGGQFFRNNTALAGGPVTHNGIQFQSSFQSTALDLTLASITTNTNANAVDVLFQPD